MARERIVFRIEKGQGPGLGLVLAGFTLVGAIAFDVTDAAPFWGSVAAAAVVGYLIGNAAKKRRCSHCDTRVAWDADECRGCGGVIKGNVSHAREVEAARKALDDDA